MSERWRPWYGADGESGLVDALRAVGVPPAEAAELVRAVAREWAECRRPREAMPRSSDLRVAIAFVLARAIFGLAHALAFPFSRLGASWWRRSAPRRG